ncbi:MAG: RDD family protein, partial [Bdellovibrionales bacterium]|nr:RDD family protein [Bdellovibrionales bacterium]
MAAFVLDFTVVFFSHSFLGFYFKRQQNIAMIEGFQTAFIFWLAVNFIFFLLLYFTYHYVSLAKFATTPGKYVFRILLKNIWGYDQISRAQA